MRTRGLRPQHKILVPPAGCSLRMFLKTECWSKKIRPLTCEYRDSNGRPPSQSADEYRDFVVGRYFPYLRADVVREITPRLAESAKVKHALEQLFNPSNRLPQEVADEALRIYKLFDKMEWNSSPRTPTIRRAARLSNDPQFAYPPSEHPIWGDDGIMRGVLMAKKGRIAYRIDDRYPRRNSEIIGHNGLEPGQWFARQHCAVVHGAHAQTQRGIAGNQRDGAYSIVVSGVYKDQDSDEGDVIYYSAEGARDKNASQKADAVGNQALAVSWRSGQPVRVLRSSSGSSPFAPACGIRYDGLYRVVDFELRRNKIGGLYRRYELRRLSGQRSLEEIVRTIPTAQEQADEARITEGY